MKNILSTSDTKRYKGFLDTEIEAASMYHILADNDSSPERSKQFKELAMSEIKHAQKWASLIDHDIKKIKFKRHSLKLLNELKIKKKLISIHDYNEVEVIRKISKNLKNSIIISAEISKKTSS